MKGNKANKGQPSREVSKDLWAEVSKDLWAVACETVRGNIRKAAWAADRSSDLIAWKNVEAAVEKEYRRLLRLARRVRASASSSSSSSASASASASDSD